MHCSSLDFKYKQCLCIFEVLVAVVLFLLFFVIVFQRFELCCNTQNMGLDSWSQHMGQPLLKCCQPNTHTHTHREKQNTRKTKPAVMHFQHPLHLAALFNNRTNVVLLNSTITTITSRYRGANVILLNDLNSRSIYFAQSCWWTYCVYGKHTF